MKTASRASPSVAKALLGTPGGYANDYAKNNDVLQENPAEEKTRWKDGGWGEWGVGGGGGGGGEGGVGGRGSPCPPLPS